MRFIDLAPELMLDEEDDHYIDHTNQKQSLFIQSFKQSLQASNFQDDWLNNDIK